MVRDTGFNAVRVFITWPVFEPAAGSYNTTAFDNLRRLLDMARAAELAVNLDLFVGGMSGAFYWPGWATGHNLYSDPMMTQRTVAFARHAVRAVADFAGTIYAVSLGNEMNNVDTNPASGCTVPQILAWTDAIVSAIHAELPGLCGLMGGWWW